MNKQTVQRRDFLKSAGSFLIGVVLIPFERLLRRDRSEEKGSTSTKEAMHYTAGDNLTG